MTFVPVKKLPEKKHSKKCHMKNLEKMLADFMASSNKIAKVVIDKNDYARVGVCRTALTHAVKMYNYPIKVHCRGDQVYLVKETL